MTEQNIHVVVIGGGYAGVMAANRLAQRASVTLVNPRGAFVERIRLHQLVAGNDGHLPITDGRISHFYAIRNPAKLSGIDIPREISR